MRTYYENRVFKTVFYRCQRNDDCDVHFHRDIEIIHVVSGCLDMTVRNEKKMLMAPLPSTFRFFLTCRSTIK